MTDIDTAARKIAAELLALPSATVGTVGTVCGGGRGRRHRRPRHHRAGGRAGRREGVARPRQPAPRPPRHSRRVDAVHHPRGLPVGKGVGMTAPTPRPDALQTLADAYCRANLAVLLLRAEVAQQAADVQRRLDALAPLPGGRRARDGAGGGVTAVQVCLECDGRGEADRDCPKCAASITGACWGDDDCATCYGWGVVITTCGVCAGKGGLDPATDEPCTLHWVAGRPVADVDAGGAGVSAPDLTVISLGAGVQSSALLLLACADDLPDGYQRPTHAIFADTGDEPQSVYDWLEVLEGVAAEHGIEVVRCAHPSGMSLSEWSTRTDAGATSTLGVPMHVANTDGTNSIARRQCTSHWKIRPVRREVARLVGGSVRGKRVDMLLGISRDESARMKPSGVAAIVNRWPLVDMGWRRERCRSYVESWGLGTPPRSACVFCPYRSDSEWAHLRDAEPEAFAAAVAYERDAQAANKAHQDEYQRTGRKRGAYDGELFLHRSRQSLPLVSLVSLRPEDDGQLSIFGDECEGMCGV